MPYYFWKGVQRNGKISIGQHYAKNYAAQLAHLFSAGITPIKISREYFYWTQAACTTDILHFTQQLTVLIQARVPLSLALSTLHASQKNNRFKSVIAQIQNDLQAGMSLAQAMQNFPRLFTEEYCAFIAAGETTGQLAEAFQQLFKLLQQKQKIKHQIKKTLSYPIFLLCCTLLITLGSLFYILPQYQQFFSELGGELPFLTKLLLKLALAMQHHYCILMNILVIFFFGGYFALQSRNLSKRLHQYILHVPLLRSLVLHAAFSQWSYLLAIAWLTNIPLLAAINLANRILTNRYLEQLFSTLPENLTRGASLHECLQALHLLPLTTLQMIFIGENTGTLGVVFSNLATNHLETFTEQLAHVIKYAEPIIMILLALLAGIIIAALYLPMIHLGLEIRS
ncbi:MAG: hypothetical protein A3F10_02745 [Coxiella sp. RIFCSPHIGHO2_12_FULL_42_15]|nr:MAG: hypothetical protein A3F10_02745 [Coxiella sp. RIFCSPHIGHO2_12_FULL_42_15]